MKKFVRKNLAAIIVVVVAIVAIGGVGWYLAANQAPSFAASTVGRGNVIQSVDEPGTVLAENDVAMSFEEPGQITAVNVREGDAVFSGEVLASLDVSSLMANLTQASATFAAAEANLDELASGTRPEQLQINQSGVVAAQASVNSATASLAAAAGSAYAAADDAVHNQADNLFSNLQSSNPTFLVPLSDSQMGITIVDSRISLIGIMKTWYSVATASSSNPVAEANLASTDLKTIQSYLDALALAVNNAASNGTITASALTGYKMNVVAARTEVTAAIGGLTTAQNAVAGATSALTVAQNELALAQAGATPQDIEAARAAAQEAQAAVLATQIAVNHAELVAPFAGTVQGLAAKVGQVVSPGIPMLSVMNSAGLKVEAYASEADVGKISAHDPANVTLDAYGTGTAFPATVTTIDSTETQANGSPSYQITLHFTNPDGRVKDGMTGDVRIITAEHDNVIEVPSRLVINSGNGSVVLVKNGGATEQHTVQTGIVGGDGMTEITSGLNVGDQLANF
jgi:HlyD family secretion protein